MDEFIEYQRFTTLDDATFLIDLLDANQIPFKIDDSATRFDLAATTINPLKEGLFYKLDSQTKKEWTKLILRLQKLRQLMTIICIHYLTMI